MHIADLPGQEDREEDHEGHRVRETVKLHIACHPEPAERGEGPHNCNPRVRFHEKAQIAPERSLSVLRWIGMTTREGDVRELALPAGRSKVDDTL